VPLVNLGPDQTFCPKETTEIGIPSIDEYTYVWNTGQKTNYITTQTESNTYLLTAENHTCKASDVIFIKVLDNCLIKVANAFTPNGDGLNDQLKAINADLATNFIFKVYSRFGQLIFATTNPLVGWDGKIKGQPADQGTYVWQLSYIDPISHKQSYQKGASTLIR
jgi:gliding motility-associated-like protein